MVKEFIQQCNHIQKQLCFKVTQVKKDFQNLTIDQGNSEQISEYSQIQIINNQRLIIVFIIIINFTMGCLLQSTSYQKGSIHHHRYKVIQQIGLEQRCQIYLVEDQKTKNFKKLKKFFMKDNIPINILLLMKTLIELKHTNIIIIEQYYSYQFRDSYYLCVVTQHLQIHELVNSFPNVSEQEIAKIQQQAKSALQFLHNNKLVYKNLTLSTILLDNNKNVKLSQIPLLQISYDYVNDSYQKKELIPYLYKSPEIFMNHKQILTPKFDIWTLGIVMIQLSTKLEIELLANINKKNEQVVQNFAKYAKDPEAKLVRSQKLNRPAFNQKFVTQTFQKLNIKSQFQPYINSLLKFDPIQRKFYIRPNQRDIKSQLFQQKNNQTKQITKTNQNVELIKKEQYTSDRMKYKINKVQFKQKLKIVEPICQQELQQPADIQVAVESNQIKPIHKIKTQKFQQQQSELDNYIKHQENIDKFVRKLDKINFIIQETYDQSTQSCLICLDPITFPVKCLVCHTIFCKKCALQWQTNMKICPKKCSQTSWRFQAIQGLGILLKCPYNSINCKNMSPQQFQNHYRICFNAPNELKQIIKKESKQKGDYKCDNGHQLEFMGRKLLHMVYNLCASCKIKSRISRSICMICKYTHSQFFTYCGLCRLPPITRSKCPYNHQFKDIIPRNKKTVQCDICSQYIQKNGSHCYNDNICDMALCVRCYNKLPIQDNQQQKKEVSKQMIKINQIEQQQCENDENDND